MTMYRGYFLHTIGNYCGHNLEADSMANALILLGQITFTGQGKVHWVAVEVQPSPCPFADTKWNDNRIQMIEAGQVPGALWFGAAAEPVKLGEQIVPTTPTPGPRKPPPGLPMEVHNTSVFDPAAAWEATKLACKGQ